MKNKKKKRERLEIIRDMLSIALEETKKTRIMYQANLNYRQLEKYLKSLLDSGLVQCHDDCFYLITWKGKLFLQKYTDYLKRCGRIGDEMKEAHKNRLLLENMCFGNEHNQKLIESKKEILV